MKVWVQNTVGQYGNTPLHLAGMGSQLQVARHLLAAGASVVLSSLSLLSLLL